MTLLGCDLVGERLDLFHDGELPAAERLEVAEHLEMCPRCRAAMARTRALGLALRETRQLVEIDHERLAALASSIVSRAGAEHRVSLRSRVREMFEDLHMVLSGAAAMVAVFTCVAVGSTLLRAVAAERADSLAGLLSALATPGSNENPVALGLHMSTPYSTAHRFPDVFGRSRAEESDIVFALAAVVTQDGRIVNPAVLMGNREDRALVLGLMDAINKARFEPARFAGEPVAVNMVWLFTHTTVRGRKA